jgi:predicted transposase/invertase (TIGR01784 family)
MENENRNIKNSVFTTLFNNPDILRELYSAIEGVTIPPDTLVDINTLTDILYRGRINDMSFTIDNRLVVLIEHQSTINDNIPLRMLMYVARVYEKIINWKKIYQAKLEKIPSPEFIVLYNGKYKYPDYAELKLSDAFKDVEGLKLTDSDTIPLELIVHVYNINYGHNPEILKRCETLNSYSISMDKVWEYRNNKSLDNAEKKAIEYCIEKDILKEFLEAHGSEVLNMLMSEWNQDEALEVAREEGREDGLELAAYNALTKGISVQTVQEITGLDLNTIDAINAKL